jgi:hypothetical protein
MSQNSENSRNQGFFILFLLDEGRIWIRIPDTDFEADKGTGSIVNVSMLLAGWVLCGT